VARWRFILVLLLLPILTRAQINTDRVMLMGRNALYYEDYVLGIQRFNMVINAKPHLAEPYFYRGLAKFYLEDYNGADTDCTSAIERNPYNENNYVLRALCRVNMHQYDKAEEDYLKSTKINRLNTSSWHNLVLCQLEQKKYEQADSSLDFMIRQWPKESNNYTLKAQIALAYKDTTLALEWVERSLSVNPYEGPAWSMKAMVLCNRGNYKEGEEALDKAILQMPRNAGLYINRALARYNQTNLRGAMSDYDAALEIEPGNYLGHFNRALLRAEVGDDNRAIEDFNFVLRQEPDNTIALYNRALLLDHTGDYRGAIRDISAVIADYPEFWEGYRTRASIRRKLGDVYGAERDEFKVLKAEMEKRTGTYRSKHKTRKKSSKNPEEYNLLVEEDEQVSEQEYASEYRGKVQNRSVDLVPEPLYVLSFYRKESETKRFIPFHKAVEALNSSNLLSRSIYLTDDEGTMSEREMNAHLEDISQISVALDQDSENASLYLKRALDYYHVRDFVSAIGDLDRVLTLDANNVLAYFLRAQMRCCLIQATQPQGGALPLSPTTEARLGYGKAIDDLERVLKLAPDMVYAQYNIGNIRLQLHDYDLASKAFTRAIEMEPRFPDAYYNRGVTRLLDGHLQEGLSDLSQAGEYGLYSAYSLIKRYSKEKK